VSPYTARVVQVIVAVSFITMVKIIYLVTATKVLTSTSSSTKIQVMRLLEGTTMLAQLVVWKEMVYLSDEKSIGVASHIRGS